MSDLSRIASDGETPVNPYSLLDAVNRSSDTAHTAWLIFLGIMTYLMIAVAGVSHQDLLLETPVSLPILQVDIPLTQFFQFAPIVLVLFHIGLVGQLVLLARKTLEFDSAIRLLETSHRRTHPLRLELHNFFFVQAIAGSHRSAVMGGFLHAMSWLTLVILPVVLLLYIQVMFLPYHDTAITWTHRLALVFDIGMLSLLGIFLRRAEASFFSAFFRTAIAFPISFVATSGLLLTVMVFSFLFATVPGEALDRVARSIFPVPQSARERGYYTGFVAPISWLDEQGRLFGIFRRNLKVTDTDLVVDRDVSAGEATINLRGRDLRSAELDRSDLHQADLTGANLDGASLSGADLRDVSLNCADIDELLLSEDRAAAVCASARNVDFSGARMTGAVLTGLDMRGSRFEETDLTGAHLAYALISGTNFSSAKLDKANLTGGVRGAGANFLIASLQGADLTGAKLYGADFRSSRLQGAMLNYAHLQGALFADAELDAASLQRAQLMGADMQRANITAADLRGARVFKSVPPLRDDGGLADVTGLDLSPPDESDLMALRSAVNAIGDADMRRQVRESLAAVLDVDAGWNDRDRAGWAAMIDAARVNQQAGAGSGGVADPVEGLAGLRGVSYADRLTRHLVQLVCRTRWSDGAIASGVTLRARAPDFRADVKEIYEQLVSEDCPAGKGMDEDVLRDLSTAADGSAR